MAEAVLTRTDASAAVADIGWRYLLATLAASVTVGSLQQAVQIATVAGAACGSDADAHLRIDLRPDRVELVLHDRALGGPTAVDSRLAAAITDAIAEIGGQIGPPTTEPAGVRGVQTLEIAIDTLDREAIRPFWKAVLGYQDEPGANSDNGIALVPTAGRTTPAAQPHPLRPHRRARRGRQSGPGGRCRGRPVDQRLRVRCLPDPGRPGRQRDLRLHLAGPRLIVYETGCSSALSTAVS